MNYELNDNELIYMIRENNEEAWDLMMKKYEPLLNKLAFYYEKTYKKHETTDIEDLLQELKITFFKSVNCYKSEYDVKFFTYLFSALKNTCQTFYTKASYKNQSNELLTEDILKYETTQIKDEMFLSIYDNQLNTKLQDFNLELDSFDSCVFLLKLASFTYEEIAILLNTNKKKVDNSIYKTRRKLKQYLKQEEILN